MRFDVSPLKARRNENERMWRTVKAVVASVLVGCAGLTFGFAMGLHDARWSGAWSQVGYASLPFSSAPGTEIALATADAT
jgi:vacuolar-type H+-ATPase subunit I/STV1